MQIHYFLIVLVVFPLFEPTLCVAFMLEFFHQWFSIFAQTYLVFFTFVARLTVFRATCSIPFSIIWFNLLLNPLNLGLNFSFSGANARLVFTPAFDC